MFTDAAKQAFLTFVIHPAENPILEALFTTRYDDARAELLRLLLLLPQDALQASIRRLCASKKAALRAAGQELSSRTSNILMITTE